MVKRAAEDATGDSGATAAPAGTAATAAPPALGESSPDEALHGTWDSGKGKCRIGKDMITARLFYEEALAEGERLHGWLNTVDKEKSLWQGSLGLLKAGRGPWYGPSFGEPPQTVGDIQVRLLPDQKPSAM